MLIVLGAGSASIDWTRLVMNLGILLAALTAGAILIWVIKRRFASDQGDNIQGFTLQDLRDMKARGDLDDDEYEGARAMILGQYAARENPGTDSDDGYEDVPEERPGHVSQGGEDGVSRGR